MFRIFQNQISANSFDKIQLLVIYVITLIIYIWASVWHDVILVTKEHYDVTAVYFSL